jgi:hypothetical protein
VSKLAYRFKVYFEMYLRQLRDANAQARLTLFQRCRRGHRLGTMSMMVIKGPPYRAPLWLRWRWWLLRRCGMRLAAIMLLIWLPASAMAQMWPSAGLPNGFQQLSVTTAASLTVPAGTTFALITVDTNNARWRDDGVAPTAAIGILLPTAATALHPFVYASPKGLATLQFIAVTGTSVLNVAYYK